ncbi:sugar-binding domain-containing protein [Catenisphaera adipataccumulans]|uniref:DNA-binding transcriptional regulator LsrR (DeoR family) n=1 Tax=Catenisphaera adipataccumulans TaxID=700500 RepID=A0A7W8FVE2_9FIRM|nr:DNA-binding transcriptional regulator LsrR (DeoR family) [Catenisphaera adipataccumulans]
MKKVVDDPRLIYKCCYLYYKDGLSQFQICDQLGISRSTVSRLLKAGRERNVVQITLNNPDSVLYGELERKLEGKLGLKELLIVDEIDLGNQYDHLQRVKEEALSYFSRVFHDNDYIGVSMGSTLYNIASTNLNVEEVNCTFVPVLGGVGTKLHGDEAYHSNEIANAFARKFHGSAVQFYSPAIFDNVEVMRGLSQEKTIQEVTKLFMKLDAVIMGIGATASKGSRIVECGYVTKEEYQQFAERGVVGDVLLRMYGKDGNEEPYNDFNDRVMGLSTEQLMKVENRIGIAVGEEKAWAVLGALRSKRINVLITDISCVKKVVSLVEDE